MESATYVRVFWNSVDIPLSQLVAATSCGSAAKMTMGRRRDRLLRPIAAIYIIPRMSRTDLTQRVRCVLSPVFATQGWGSPRSEEGNTMTPEEHARKLGSLVGNMQGLEHLLRVFLYHLENEPPSVPPPGGNLYTLPVGSQVLKNALTNYDSLAKLFRKFNSEMAKRGEDEIDATRIVAVRDALAHGRVSSPDERNHNQRLLKFSNPDKGPLCVEFNEVMSADWFREENRRVLGAIRTIGKRCDRNKVAMHVP